MMKAKTCLILVLAMALCGPAFGFAGGDGSSGSPYQITTQQHLEAVNNAPNAHYILMNDIDLIGTVYDNSVIAFDTDHTTTSFDGVVFSGHFDGNGNVIKNLKISTTQYGYLGLFGSVSGVIENLGLEDVDVTGSGYWQIGALVGNLSGQIINCSVTGTVQGSDHHTGGMVGLSTGLVKGCWADVEVTGSNRVAGLVGSNSVTGTIVDSQSAGLIRGSSRVGGITGHCTAAIVKNSSSSATVEAISTMDAAESYFGGIVGRCELASLIINSYATGDVTGDMLGYDGDTWGRWTGGVAGYIRDASAIVNCYATGTVQAAYLEIGGLLGRNEGSLVLNSYATGEVIGDPSWYDFGGLVGFNREGGVIVNSYSTGAVSSGGGGLVGGSENSTTINSFYDTTTSGATFSVGGTGLDTASMQDITTFVGADWTFYDDPSAGAAPQWIITAGQYPQIYRQSASFVSPFVGGDGTPESPYQIATRDHLEAMIYDMSASYILLNDIDLVAEPTGTTAPIARHWDGTNTSFNGAAFLGTFDGDGHAIKNLTLDGGADENFVGLFGFIGQGGVVANLGVENAEIVAHRVVGVLVGQNEGTITNCYATGQIDASGLFVGGLVGDNFATVEGSYAAVNVACDSRAGGLIGRNAGSISACHATGNATSIGNYAAGITGFNSTGGSISDSYATGNASGVSYIGGIVGRNYGPITNCHATGTITATDRWAGGLVGYHDPGTGNTADILNCYAEGNISGGVANSDTEFGGLVGRFMNGTLGDCYATGTVQTDGRMAGGLVGRNYAAITRSYATGNATAGQTYAGGLVARSGGDITESFATGNASATGRWAGGLVGYNDGTIERCYAIGSAASQDGDAGGLIGDNRGLIADCYAEGDASAPARAGGFVGAQRFGTGWGIEKSYSTGSASGNSQVGGFAGIFTVGNIENCFWDTDTSGLSDGVGDGDESGVTGKTTAEMKTAATFTAAGWDFATVWFNCEAFSYPRLVWQEFSDADINLDGLVNIDDLELLADYWLETVSGLCVDIDGDGRVDLADFAMLSSDWLVD